MSSNTPTPTIGLSIFLPIAAIVPHLMLKLLSFLSLTKGGQHLVGGGRQQVGTKKVFEHQLSEFSFSSLVLV